MSEDNSTEPAHFAVSRYFAKRFGFWWSKRAVLKRMRAGLDRKTAALIFGFSRPAIYALCRRNKIPSLRIGPEYTFIYSLTCPLTGEVRWIGKSDNPHKRLNGHLYNATNALMADWIESLKAQGLRPIVGIVAKVKNRLWRRAERAFIRKFAKSHPLLNIWD